MAESQTSLIPSERLDVLHEATGEPFRYPPLSSTSVRFLNLHPSPDGNEKLSCTFVHLAISPDTEYEILSGYWGDQSPFQPVSIVVDARSCTTTPQLAEGLCRFRHKDKPRLIWVQSLCIDPQSISERNIQISRLREIIQSSQRLIVWLGGARDNSDAVFEHLSQFRHLITEHNWPQIPPPVTDYWDFGVLIKGSAAPERVAPYPSEAASSFTKLCLRPWFHRPWSLPELALSRSILLVCGDHQLQEVPWWNPTAMLVDAYQASPPRLITPCHTAFFADLDLPPADPISHVSSLAFHARSPDSCYLLGGLAFENAYRIVRNCRVTDRRDSVFAIATLDAVPPVSIDYSLSVSDVYQQATFALLQRHQSIQVLRRLASPTRDPDIPSWALDFSAPLETAGALWALPGALFIGGLEQIQYLMSVEEFDAIQRGHSWGGILWSRRGGKLIISGHFMESISAMGPVMPPPADGEMDRAALIAWEELASRLQTQGKRFPQSIADAFFDTILANDTHEMVRGCLSPKPLVSHTAGRVMKW
ncbi:heterokaryon incompatibility protein-domain-containing protein [Podospora conica]|nr:heterokaryon incompatibility protein-domain-containing protein [Schizothecium conicum]